MRNSFRIILVHDHRIIDVSVQEIDNNILSFVSYVYLLLVPRYT